MGPASCCQFGSAGSAAERSHSSRGQNQDFRVKSPDFLNVGKTEDQTKCWIQQLGFSQGLPQPDFYIKTFESEKE